VKRFIYQSEKKSFLFIFSCVFAVKIEMPENQKAATPFRYRTSHVRTIRIYTAKWICLIFCKVKLHWGTVDLPKVEYVP